MSSRTTRPTFLTTVEYGRFTEFADAVRRERYIGLCYGPPGVGKTLSARHYAHWDATEHYLTRLGRPHLERGLLSPPVGIAEVRTVFWTAPVLSAVGQMNRNLIGLCVAVDAAIRSSPQAGWRSHQHSGFPHVELIVVDEADRLKTTGLEQLRAIYDHHGIGLILIGMPGLQRRLTRYPQLYSRVGFAHEYRPLKPTDLLELLNRHATDLGLRPLDGGLGDRDALAAIARITGGNLRLVQRLIGQINRILEINDLDTVTADVVQTARESLIIGGE